MLPDNRLLIFTRAHSSTGIESSKSSIKIPNNKGDMTDPYSVLYLPGMSVLSKCYIASFNFYFVYKMRCKSLFVSAFQQSSY